MVKLSSWNKSSSSYLFSATVQRQKCIQIGQQLVQRGYQDPSSVVPTSPSILSPWAWWKFIHQHPVSISALRVWKRKWKVSSFLLRKVSRKPHPVGGCPKGSLAEEPFALLISKGVRVVLLFTGGRKCYKTTPPLCPQQEKNSSLPNFLMYLEPKSVFEGLTLENEHTIQNYHQQMFVMNRNSKETVISILWTMWVTCTYLKNRMFFKMLSTFYKINTIIKVWHQGYISKDHGGGMSQRWWYRRKL